VAAIEPAVDHVMTAGRAAARNPFLTTLFGAF
jgi:hypothetical protein